MKYYGEVFYIDHFLQKGKALRKNSYLGYEYLIMNLGPWPTAYVAIPKGKPFYNTGLCEEFTISCHGGCTFNNWGYHGEFDEYYKVIGWDYGHAGDFSGYCSYIGSKKYTVKDIIKDCKQVISALYVTDNWKSLYM